MYTGMFGSHPTTTLQAKAKKKATEMFFRVANGSARALGASCLIIAQLSELVASERLEPSS